MIWQFGIAGKSQLLICFAADPAGSLFAGVDVAKGQYGDSLLRMRDACAKFHARIAVPPETRDQ